MSEQRSLRISNILERTPLDDRGNSARRLIMRAHAVAEQAHSGQKRKSGAAYIQHPLAVAYLLADLGMDADTIVAGLLHDVIEDSDMDLDRLTKEFGSNVAGLVDSVTKLDRIGQFSLQGEERRDARETESLRKMFIAMAEDIRVVMIKLADRLHNMRTLAPLPPERRRGFAVETLDIFAPLANRLGVWQWKWELEDLSLQYIDDDAYQRIAAMIQERHPQREQGLQRQIDVLRRELAREGIEAEITGRPKHIHSIYSKMQRKDVPFSQVYDVRAIRAVTQAIPDCYHLLGIVHGLWKPIPGEFDDYIASPKDNMYQSLHTAVVGDDGKTLEVQIRTQEMHRLAEYGVAAHWRYKEGGKHDEAFDAKIAWLRWLMDWRQDITDASEFMDAMRTDLFQDRVYAFTPKGKIIDLPVGATPIDFAYQIHTEIGHRCRGAKINDKWRGLDYQLCIGDRVEIITGKRAAPSRDWLNPSRGYVTTTRARTKIRQWFRRQDRDQNVARGREMVERELKRLGLEQVGHETVARLFGQERVEDFHAAVGFGDIHSPQIASKVAEVRPDQGEEGTRGLPLPLPPPPEPAVEGIEVQGTGGLLTRLAQCCHPLPGNDIIGYVTRGRGVTVHRRDCPNALRLNETGRLIEVSWGTRQQTIPTAIRILAYDRTGLLHEIAGVISAENINIDRSGVELDHRKNITTIYITVEISNITQLSRVLTRIEQLPNVIEARRYTR